MPISFAVFVISSGVTGFPDLYLLAKFTIASSASLLVFLIGVVTNFPPGITSAPVIAKSLKTFPTPATEGVLSKLATLGLLRIGLGLSTFPSALTEAPQFLNSGGT